MFEPTTTESQERIAGVLVPVFAIRRKDDLGIGDVAGLQELIDWAEENGLGFIQVLPVNEMGGDNSPYNAISSIALEPLTLDVSPDAMADLSRASYGEALAAYDLEDLRKGPVQYPKVRKLKSDLLWRAFRAFRETHFSKNTPREKAFLNFCATERGWLYDYCLYRLFLDMEEGREDWEHWPESYNTIEKARAFLDHLIQKEQSKAEYQLAFYAYVQFIAREQWSAVTAYGRSRGVKLMGDVPFGVSRCSADVFANPALFDPEWSGGAPPETNFKADEFTVRWGQNWGIPLYRWEEMEKDGFAWWRQRIAKLCQNFDIFRIDHALGFYRIYSFPWRPDRNGEFLHLSHDEAGERTGGHLPGFKPGPDDTEEDCARNRSLGEKYLEAVKEAAGNSGIVAEDLGTVPDYVPESLLSLGMAGMKVPQWITHPDGEYQQTDSYPWLSLTTYATHDHEPIKTQWNRNRDTVIHHQPEENVHQALLFLHRFGRFAGIDMHDRDIPGYGDEVREKLLAKLFEAPSRYAAVMITDLFGLEERFNVPGLLSEQNWSHRLPMTVSDLRDPDQEWSQISSRVKNLLKESGRLLVVA